MRLVFRVHAVERMFGRGISEEDVRHALANGEEIESYPEDAPYPSRLVTFVITVYEPSLEHREPDFRTRRSP